VASIEAFSYPQTNSNLNDFLLSDESLRIWYLQRLEEWANLPSEDGSREHGLVGKTWRRGPKVLIGKAGSCPWEIPFMEVHFLVRFPRRPDSKDVDGRAFVHILVERLIAGCTLTSQ
jgi:hypothetical protein